MKNLFIVFFVMMIFSCAKKSPVEIYQGNLDEFIDGEFLFEKDSSTVKINLEKVISWNGKKFFVSREDQGYSLFSVDSGKKEFSFRIPKEGPLSLKGHGIASQTFDENEFIALSSQGNVKKYKHGLQIQEIDLDWTEYQERMIIQMSDLRDNFLEVGEGRYQLVNNPFDLFDEEKSVDLNYRKWLVEFDLNNGWICNSDFKAPLGNEFSNSTSASSIISVFNDQKDEFYFMFAPSDSLYQIKNCKVLKKIALESKSELKYLPGIYEQNGKNKNWRNNPESSSNVALLFDSVNKLYVRKVLLKTEETQPEITDIRKRQGLNKKYFLFLIYDLEWKIKAELSIFYDAGQNSSQIISPEGGILVSKPEQASEDEYEFYKIDLSRFAD
ncbi:hypothetical protein [Algoriphagus pacificus]|uniref:TolB-like 6-blade propeller-like n=1 Tax=Algoriphagus pacificus TaxID=2811234 RepID=A0ABS3CM50_9BACT|nr:hypothetical protein [Algoriphagus pacificus]MBN7818117.1 hypothetical protein [Algoriphagus pacificus]